MGYPRFGFSFRANVSIKQNYVQSMGCSSPLLGALAAGNVIGYSSILLRQLKNDDSTIRVNSSEESWIGE